jgi:hypothetical protein
MVLNISKAAQWLGKSERTIRLLCKDGKLEGAYQVSGYQGMWLIPISALEKITPCPDWLKEVIFANIANLKRVPVK